MNGRLLINIHWHSASYVHDSIDFRRPVRQLLSLSVASKARPLCEGHIAEPAGDISGIFSFSGFVFIIIWRRIQWSLEADS